MVKKGTDTQEVRFYVRNARKAIVYDTAAKAWAQGVPWEEALQLSENAMAASGVPPGKGKGSAKGKGNGKAKSRAKPRAKSKAKGHS